MAKIPIFIIHGVGDYVDITDKGIVHDDAWFQSVKKSIANAYDSYDELKKTRLDDLVDFVDVHYDEVFETIVQQWDDERARLTSELPNGSNEHAAVTRTIEVLDGVLKHQTVRTHVLDVVFWGFVQLVREDVKNLVAHQIREKLLTAQTRWRGEWHVIAHSMGTSVAHDALQGMFTDDGDFGVNDCWCGTLMMVANCSRLLEDRFKSAWDVYKSVVKPQLLAGNTAVNTYINVWHELDPVAMPRRFAPDASWVDAATLSKRYVPVPFNDARSRDIHALESYFENPEVHVPFFRSVFGAQCISEKEEGDKLASYRTKTVPGAFDALRGELKKLSMNDSADWAEIIEKFVKFRAVIEDFVKAQL